MKRNVAIVWGGYSSEKVVSAKSMKGIYSFIDKDKYNAYTVKIDRSEWSIEFEEKVYPVDKNDFSFYLPAVKQKIKFDFAYITIHGTPGEDGCLQGYLDMLGIPYSNCGLMASALTFNKYVCNKFLKNFGICVAESVILRNKKNYSCDKIVEVLKLPVFVKPNVGGSSFATTKVKQANELEGAINTAFNEANEVLIESFIKGREVTCGCYKTADKSVVFPITEVITQNEFFDYKAKYEGEVKEITPADLPDELAENIQQITANIYDLVNAKGIIRVDFIITDDNTPVLLEVNTTPGMTPTSFIPQQVAAAGLTMKDVITDIIENEFNANI